MRTEGEEIHGETDEARAGSTPNIVRWVLAISLLAAIVLLSLIWITGAASTSKEDRVANATDRAAMQDDGDSTDSIVSDEPALIAGPDAPAPADAPDAAPVPDAPAPSPTPE